MVGNQEKFNQIIHEDKLLFRQPFLELKTIPRFLWRIISFSFYAVFCVATFFFLLFDITWLRWVGVLFLLFIIDWLVHFKRAAHSISEIKNIPIDGINVADYIAPQALKALSKAYDKTSIVGGNFHLNLLKVLSQDKGIRGALWRLEVSPEEFEKKVDDEIGKIKKSNPPSQSQKELLDKIEVLVKKAFIIAYSSNSNFIEKGDIFASLSVVPEESVKAIFYIFSINPNDLEKALIFSRFRYKTILPKLPKFLGGFALERKQIRHRYMNRSWTAKPTPILDRYSIDITDLARAGAVGLLVGHEKEHQEAINILAKLNKPNVLLIGEPGSGKETIISHLALDITKDKVPQELFDKRVVSLSISRLVSGADPQEVSKRATLVLNEILSAKNIILYIPDIHNLIKTSGEHFINVADIFLPIVSSSDLQVIGATYPKEFKLNIEPRSDFLDSFEIIRVEELSEDEAIKVLTYDSILSEKEYGIIISFNAIKEAVVLAHKYFRQKLLPSSAQDLLKEALAYVTQKNEKVLKADHVIEISERKVNIPLHKATKEEAEKLLNLEKFIHKDLIDQEEAVKAVARSLREYRSGLSKSNGPIAVFLFVGPTGVGKTELSKILAKTQFGKEDMMVRFDMSEYQDKQSIFRFIGSPDGKITGALTESIIQKPYSLILLDEFEKAHNDVLNIFLQVFDDGRLTDNTGRVVDFKNTIIIATSNALSDFIREKIESGKTISEFRDEFKKKLTGFFRPELLNRFSDVIIFKNLSQNDIVLIAKLQLEKLAKTMEENNSIILSFTDEVFEYVAKLGYDPVFGARPLKGVISDKIKSILAEKILKEEIKKGDKIEAAVENGEIKFK